MQLSDIYEMYCYHVLSQCKTPYPEEMHAVHSVLLSDIVLCSDRSTVYFGLIVRRKFY